MAELIEALPGVELPVGAVLERLETMWESGPSSSPSEFRASQMNLVLHFGMKTPPEKARERFEGAVRFAQRYPSRIIVLCPGSGKAGGGMTAKLFSQCYIGESHREMCCCEALLLSYEKEDADHLANQVSVWLESDLPTYHWFSNVPPERIELYSRDLLAGVRRYVYDSSIEPPEIENVEWPDPARVADLARARLLPVRQALGQFFSGYPMDTLCRGLRTVTVWHGPDTAGEARRLTEWVRSCLEECVSCAESGEEGKELPGFSIRLAERESSPQYLEMEWEYGDGRYFHWRREAGGSVGEIAAKLGAKEERVPTRVKALAPEEALAEALFF